MQVVGNAVRADARTASDYLPAAVVVTPSVHRAPPVTGHPATTTTLDVRATLSTSDTTRTSVMATTATRASATVRPTTATTLDIAVTPSTNDATHASAMATTVMRASAAAITTLDVAATPSPTNLAENMTPTYATRSRSTLSTTLAYNGVLRAHGGGNDGRDSVAKWITYTLPQQLTLSNLRCTNKEGLVDMKQVKRLASFGFMFHSHLKGKSSATIQEEMKRMKLVFPRDFAPEWFADGNLTTQSINSGKKNIKQARKEWVEVMHSMFTPQPHEHLLGWLHDAHSFTKGRRVETNNFTLSKTN